MADLAFPSCNIFWVINSSDNVSEAIFYDVLNKRRLYNYQFVCIFIGLIISCLLITINQCDFINSDRLLIAYIAVWRCQVNVTIKKNITFSKYFWRWICSTSLTQGIRCLLLLPSKTFLSHRESIRHIFLAPRGWGRLIGMFSWHPDHSINGLSTYSYG